MKEKMNQKQLSANWPEYNSKFTRDTVLLRFMSKKYFLGMINNPLINSHAETQKRGESFMNTEEWKLWYKKLTQNSSPNW